MTRSERQNGRVSTSTISLNNYQFHYVERGQGQPLVFVHGSASDYRTWQAQQAEFGQHYRTLTYSRRYHWPNKPIGAGTDYAMVEHVRDLQAFLRAHDALPVHLVGHSYGAFVSLLLAMQAPQLLRTLVLAEPPAITLFVSNPPRPIESVKLLFSRPRAAVGLIKFVATGIVPATAAMKRDDMDAALGIFGKATLGNGAFDRLSAARRQQARANLIKAELLGSGFPPLDPAKIRRIEVPTLLVSGENSVPLWHHLLDRLYELLPQVERIEIPGASHIMHEDNGPAYNQALAAFLAQEAAPAGSDRRPRAVARAGGGR